MTMVSDLEARLQKIIANQLGVEEDKVQPSAAFIADLKADSLDLAELMMSLEDEFKVVISEDDASKIKTVGDAIAYIRDHLG